EEHGLRVVFSVHRHSWLHGDAGSDAPVFVNNFEGTPSKDRCALLVSLTRMKLWQEKETEHKVDSREHNPDSQHCHGYPQLPFKEPYIFPRATYDKDYISF